MTVVVPTPLRSYTRGEATVEARGATLADVLADLDARYPGMRFRMINEQGKVREHIRFFVDGELARGLEVAVGEREVHIVCALSGG